MRPDWTGESQPMQTVAAEQGEAPLDADRGESALCAATSICSCDWFFGF